MFFAVTTSSNVSFDLGTFQIFPSVIALMAPSSSCPMKMMPPDRQPILTDSYVLSLVHSTVISHSDYRGASRVCVVTLPVKFSMSGYSLVRVGSVFLSIGSMVEFTGSPVLQLVQSDQCAAVTMGFFSLRSFVVYLGYNLYMLPPRGPSSS